MDDMSVTGGDSLELPRDPEGTPEEHPLRSFFRTVTERAFRNFLGLYHPEVERHIADEVLSEFVHMDRIHRIRDRDGRRLADLAELALEARTTGPDAGLERDLEIHQHAGDYALFMAGLFPEHIEGRRGPTELKPLLACIGSTTIALDHPVNYYIVEGRSAYSHVARVYRTMNSERSGIFDRLGNRFEQYLDLMGCIRDVLRRSPDLEGELGIGG